MTFSARSRSPTSQWLLKLRSVVNPPGRLNFRLRESPDRLCGRAISGRFDTSGGRVNVFGFRPDLPGHFFPPPPP
jgi:hypothetical protein